METELQKIHDEFVTDSKELIDAFSSFSHKYGKYVGGFKLERMYDSCWTLGIVVDGRLFNQTTSVKSD